MESRPNAFFNIRKVNRYSEEIYAIVIQIKKNVVWDFQPNGKCSQYIELLPGALDMHKLHIGL